MNNLHVKLILEAIDQLTAPIRKMAQAFKSSLREMGEHVEGIGKKLKQLGREVSHIGKFFTERLTLPITAFGALALHEAANVQELEERFRGLAGGAGEAATFVKRLMAFSHKAPFQMDDISSAAQQLMSIGYSADSTMKRLDFLGEIATATGKPLNDLVNQYIDLRVKGKASVEDLMGMTREGIPALKALADQMHISQRRVLYMAEAGQISFGRVKKALQDMTVQGGIFAKSMEEKGKSITGVFGELRKTIGDTFGEFGQVIYQQLKLGERIRAVAEYIRDLAKWFMKLPEPIKKFVVYTALIVAALGPVIFIIGQFIMGIGLMTMGFGLIAKAIGVVVTAFGALLGAIALVDIICIAFAAAGYMLIKHWSDVEAFFSSMWSNIKGVFSREIDAIMILLKPLLDAIGTVKTGWQKIKSFATDNPAAREVNHFLNGTGGSAQAFGPARPLVAGNGVYGPPAPDLGGLIKIQIDNQGNIAAVDAKPNDRRMGYSVQTGLMMGGY